MFLLYTIKNFKRLQKFCITISSLLVDQKIDDDKFVSSAVEDKKHIEDVARELHRCRAWGYKWYKRYKDNGGLEGLKDKERSSRPPDVPKEVTLQIRQELEDSKTGWDFRQTGNGSYLQ